MSVPPNSSGEVDVTPFKRKQIPSSSSDSSPAASQVSKKQEKKKRRRQRLKEASELVDKTEAEADIAEAETIETGEIMSNEQSSEVSSQLAALNVMVTNISSQMANLATNDALRNLNSELTKLVKALNERLDKVDGELFEMKNKNEGLQKALSAVSQQNSELRAEIEGQKERFMLNEKRHNDLEQHSRKQNLRVFGVPEPQGEEKETGKDCIEKVAQIFKEKVGVPIGVEHIEVAHRTGSLAAARANKRSRPIIVRFLSRKDRETVLVNRKNLKGKKVSIGEDLTITNLKVLKRLEEHSGTMSSWSVRGNLFAKLKNGVVVKVDMLSDINKVITEGLRGGGGGARSVRGENEEMV